MSQSPHPAWKPVGKPLSQYPIAAPACQRSPDEGTRLPRFGVLPLAPHGRTPRYAIYDLETQRITNGVYLVLDRALANAAYAAECGADVADMTPDAEGLGLLFPVPHAQKGEAV